MHRRSLLTAVAAAAAPLAHPAIAQGLPGRELRLICAFPPGGSGDLFFRLMADRLPPLAGRPVQVENRVGAVGMVAAEAVSRMAPDGQVLVMTSMGLHAVLPQLPGQPMPLDPDADLTPVSNGCGIHTVLVSRPDAPFREVAELIAAARAAPGRLTYASGGTGSSQHLAGEMFKRMAGVDLLHVPYRGGAQAVVDLTAGRADVMFGNLPEFLGAIRDGGLRALARGGNAIPLLPDLPPISRDVPGFEVGNWFGICGPKGMAPETVAAWTALLARLREDAVFARRVAENGMETLFGTQAEFRATIARDRARWGTVIREGGIRAE